MTIAPIPLHPLDDRQRRLMHILALLPALLLAAGGGMAGLVLREEFGLPWWPPTLLAGAVALWAVTVAPRRRWAAWGWALDRDEVHIARGVWTQTHTVVPIGRVQHIDVAQGPLERSFGLARLILHTAGTAYAIVVLPGLARGDAEQLRDTIRAQIRAEPA